MAEFFGAMLDTKYSNDMENNNYNLTECIICMEDFKEGMNITQIPICQHFFHPECIKKWFDTKYQER